MKTLIINEKYDNKKLSTIIKNEFPHLSINTYYKALRKKDIKINGKRINSDVVVHNLDEVQIYIVDDLFEPDSCNLKVVFEDENILLLDKPAGIEVTGDNSLTTLVHSKYCNCEFLPMPCHRLDRNTSGLILFAKNQRSLDILLEKFKSHEIEKHYHALVYGIPKKETARLEAYLFKDKSKSLVYISPTFKEGYSKIITSYTILEKYDNNSCLLDVSIETGKTHQIRAHLAYIGYPIIGDGKYGINEINKKFGYKVQQLHSHSLKFNFSSDSDILYYLNGKTFEL